MKILLRIARGCRALLSSNDAAEDIIFDVFGHEAVFKPILIAEIFRD